MAYATGRTAVLDAIVGRAMALDDGGILLGIAYAPFTSRPTFTFDGSNTTWLEATDFWGHSINNAGTIGGCIGIGPAHIGGIFQNGIVSQVSPTACIDRSAPRATGRKWRSTIHCSPIAIFCGRTATPTFTT